MADNLEQLSKRQLIELVRQLIGRVEALERENARLKKNSSTSSKPPSSDIVKPGSKPAKGKGRKRKIGGQPGHPKHERTPFAPEQLDAAWDYTLEQCPVCGGELKRARRKPRIIQQVELLDQPVRIEEHRAHAYWCAGCRKQHLAPLPDEVVKGGLAGPRLTALVAYLKGGCHASYSTIQAFLRDVLGLPMSAAQLVKLVQKTRRALDGTYHELLAKLPDEAHLNIDETGHKQCKKKLWTWCFRAKLYTLFKIDPSRGSRVLIDVLGKAFAGVIGSDFFWAYR